MSLNLFDESFSPGYGTPPGDTLREVLDRIGLNQSELAERTGRPKKTINEIIQGKAAITAETALQFERVLGIAASFWLNLERGYRAAQARATERERLADCVSWLEGFPVTELVKRGWIRRRSTQTECVEEMLGFFGVAFPDVWNDVWAETRRATAFRQSESQRVDFGALASWLRQGEIEGRRLACKPYDAAGFRSVLADVRGLTRSRARDAFKRVREQCATVGVALAIVPELPRAKAFGAARWLSPDKALIQLSLFFKREDQLWFSFFHESAHVLLHGRREVFVDVDPKATERQEVEANRFAQEQLIPSVEYIRFLEKANLSRTAVMAFANALGVDSGIVVGRLQHDRHLDWNQLTPLFHRVDWASLEWH